MCGSASRPSVRRRSSASPPGPSKGVTTGAASVAASRGGGRASSRGRLSPRERRDEEDTPAVRELYPKEQLASSRTRYTSAIGAQARPVLAEVRSRRPGGVGVAADKHD